MVVAVAMAMAMVMVSVMQRRPYRSTNLFDSHDLPNFLTHPGFFRVGRKVLGDSHWQRQVMGDIRQLRRLPKGRCHDTNQIFSLNPQRYQ